MCLEIKWALKQMIVTIQKWIDLISSSSPSTAVITEEMELDNKPYKFILPFEVKSIPVLHVHV